MIQEDKTSEEVDLAFVDAAVEEFGRGAEAVIPILQAIQEHYRYLPEEALEKVCDITEITLASLAGVSTFYSQFRHQPAGRYVVRVCHGTACHVKGSELVHDALRRHLGISADEDTDADGLFTLEKVACLGCCTLAPAMQIEEIIYGHLTPETIPRALRDFLWSQERRPAAGGRRHADEAADAGEIRICLDSCCIARGSGRVLEAFQQALDGAGVRATVKKVGCVGMCYETPLVEIVTPGGP
ncbi:MAG: NAD(P)H-dependent oxidoreductase subunit E, partial [Phycisphaerae bacterium]|nr:NAD(P)H-dependent oxidoreductase subunit E [Phycisphaerae bacterium]